MNTGEAEPARLPVSGEPPLHVVPTERQMDLESALGLISQSAKLLFENGQSTEAMIKASERLAKALGCQVVVLPLWGELVFRMQLNSEVVATEFVPAVPAGVDMNKVASMQAAIEQVCDGRMGISAFRSASESIVRLPPVSTGRFALFAALGAMALAVIFGTMHLLSLALIGLSAAAGALLRRWLAKKSRNPFAQQFSAALLAGVIGAIAIRLQVSSVLRLIAVCPCMILVPGPHFLNGMLDFARARVPLGIARVVFALLVTVAISAGLLLGLALGGESLPASGPSFSIPLGYDVLAAGIAVSAYGTFFSMPWRMLPIPIVVGMLAHATRWAFISNLGASAAVGAIVACFVVGLIMTPIAERVRLPFAGLAFASVVSLIPGVFLFRLAGGMVDLVALGSRAPQQVYNEVLGDGATAVLIILGMSFGLIFPRVCLLDFVRSLFPRDSKMRDLSS